MEHLSPGVLVHITAAQERAINAAREAACVIRTCGRSPGVREKAPSDLVTEADEASQALIVERLGTAFPAWGILAEEEGDNVSAPEYCWIIDPLDGTTNFAHGLAPYAISIALRLRDTVVLGVVLDVTSGDVFTAIRGSGTFRNGARVRVSTRCRLTRALVATGFPYRSFDYEHEYLESLRRFMEVTRGVRRLGAASIDLAYVACGIFDGFFEIDLRPWDVAAGLLLVEEAAGIVTDFAGIGNPLSGRQILASNGLVHNEMLQFTAPLCESMGEAAEHSSTC